MKNSTAEAGTRGERRVNVQRIEVSDQRSTDCEMFRADDDRRSKAVTELEFGKRAATVGRRGRRHLDCPFVRARNRGHAAATSGGRCAT